MNPFKNRFRWEYENDVSIRLYLVCTCKKTLALLAERINQARVHKVIPPPSLIYCSPELTATTGAPEHIASTGTMPKCSWDGVYTTHRASLNKVDRSSNKKKEQKWKKNSIFRYKKYVQPLRKYFGPFCFTFDKKMQKWSCCIQVGGGNPQYFTVDKIIWRGKGC